MADVLLAKEPLIRLVAFAGVFAIMAAWEVLAPRRDPKIGRGTRWPSNIGVVILDTALARLVFPTTAVGLAVIAESRGWGLLNASGLPVWASVWVAVMALDLAIYTGLSFGLPCAGCGKAMMH
jgi:hypothetical protein